MRHVITLFLFVFLVVNTYGQSLRIRVVEINSSNPISDVNVSGGNFSNKTDVEGFIVLPENIQTDSLTFSHLNFAKRTLSLNQVLKTSVVVLTNLGNVLETVVINTGYQKIDQRISTGAVDKIALDRTQDIFGSSIFQKLEGNSPILFDKGSNKRSMTIRGLSSINNSNLPLIILDNFPYEGDPNWINPEDIADITILKDAAASAIWGARAGNGVVVITTKKGNFNMANKINLTSAVQIQEKPDLYYLNQISSSGVIELEHFLFDKGYYKNNENSNSRPFLSPIVEHLIAIRDGLGNVADHEREIVRLRTLDVRDDYSRYMYRSSVNQNHNLSFEGGARNLRYQLSARLDDNTGTLNESSKRGLLRSFVEIELHPRIKISSDVQYVNDRSIGGRTAYSAIGTRPYMMLADVNGHAIRHADYRIGYLDTVGNGLMKDWFKYPLDEYKKRRATVLSNMVMINMSADVKITEGLNLQGSYRYQYAASENKTTYESDSYMVRDLINRYTNIDYKNLSTTSGIPNGGIIDQSIGTKKTDDVRIGLSFRKDWQGFLLTALLGAEWRNTQNENMTNKFYGFDPNTYSLAKVDYLNPYRHFINKSNIYVPYADGKTLRTDRFQSQYANASVAYRSRYILTGSVRRDASNLFGVKTNERWQPLWSAGYKWNLSEESFFLIEWINKLSIRGSYGVSGNVDQSRSAITTIRYMTPDQYTNLPRAVIAQFSNPDLRWERNSTWNTGLDFSFLSNRLNGSVDYYIKWGDDLFGTAPVDYTAIPSKGVMRNIAAMKSKGIDVNLNATIPLGSLIRFNPQLMINFNSSKVTDYHFDGTYAYQFLSNGTSVNGQIGFPVYSILAYRSLGLDNLGNQVGELEGEPSIDYQKIRLQDKSVLEYKGSVVPRYSGYFNPGVTVGSFDFTVGMLYKFGYVFKANSVRYGELIGMGALGDGSGDFDKRWKVAGDERYTTIPSFLYPNDSQRNSFYENSSALVESASHIRLQNITAAYRFSVKTKFSGRLFFNATNLGTIWVKNKKGIDPDYIGQLKPERLLSLGVRLTY